MPLNYNEGYFLSFLKIKMNLFTDLWYQAMFTAIKRELEEEFLGCSLEELPIWKELIEINNLNDQLYYLLFIRNWQRTRCSEFFFKDDLINEFPLEGPHIYQILYDYSLIVQKKNEMMLMNL